VYSRDRGNQEALISFAERINCLTLVNDGLLVLGTAEGRIILWEVSLLGDIFHSWPI
jgi:pre-rRNA-processing protein IPI3